MGYIEGESRDQRVMFPAVIDDYITAATLISKNAVPGLADDVALVTRGGQV